MDTHNRHRHDQRPIRRAGGVAALLGSACLLAMGCASDSETRRSDLTARERAERRHEVRSDRERARAERLDDHDRVPDTTVRNDDGTLRSDDRTLAETDNTVRDNLGGRDENVRDNIGVRPVTIATPNEAVSVSDTDRATSDRIRKSIADDDRLSVNAKNVQVSSTDDKVTLRGPVESAAEKARIESYAKRAAGKRLVDNQLEVTK